MEDLIKGAIGVSAIVLIGGAGFFISQADVQKNLQEETGMSQQEAEQFMKDAKGNTATWKEVGQEYIDSAKLAEEEAETIDCTAYECDWQTASLDCETGKAQILRTATAEKNLL